MHRQLLLCPASPVILLAPGNFKQVQGKNLLKLKHNRPTGTIIAESAQYILFGIDLLINLLQLIDIMGANIEIVAGLQVLTVNPLTYRSE